MVENMCFYFKNLSVPALHSHSYLPYNHVVIYSVRPIIVLLFSQHFAHMSSI